MLSVAELQEATGEVLVGKYMLAGGYPLAVFIGGALAKADDLIKNSGDQYELMMSMRQI